MCGSCLRQASHCLDLRWHQQDKPGCSRRRRRGGRPPLGLVSSPSMNTHPPLGGFSGPVEQQHHHHHHPLSPGGIGGVGGHGQHHHAEHHPHHQTPQPHLMVMDPNPFDFDAPLRAPPQSASSLAKSQGHQQQQHSQHMLLNNRTHQQQQHHSHPPELLDPHQLAVLEGGPFRTSPQHHHHPPTPGASTPFFGHHHHHDQDPDGTGAGGSSSSSLLMTQQEFAVLSGSSSSTEDNGSVVVKGGDSMVLAMAGGGQPPSPPPSPKAGDVVRLWGLEWRRDLTKEGKSTLVTTLDNEGEYERFMKRFDVEDLQEGFYWVTDRGRKYSKATSAVMQRMRWKDTFNCFFGRRHTKRGAAAPVGGMQDAAEGGGGFDGAEEGEARGGKRRRQRASQKVYCPASLSATCMMDGKVELRYYDKHVEHPVFDGRAKRKRAGGEAGGTDKAVRRTRLIQNEHVSAWRTVIKPNQPPKLHRHEKDRMVYVLKGGRLKVVGENNDVKKIYNLEPDKAYWFPKTPPGELQGDVNDGPEAIQIVVVEVESTRQPATAPGGGGGIMMQQPPHPHLLHHHQQQQHQQQQQQQHHHHHHPHAPVGGY